MDSERVLIEIQIDNIIQQVRTLTDEAIAILYEDGLLSSKYINELAFKSTGVFNKKIRDIKEKITP